jgi:hypothetical protein
MIVGLLFLQPEWWFQCSGKYLYLTCLIKAHIIQGVWNIMSKQFKMFVWTMVYRSPTFVLTNTWAYLLWSVFQWSAHPYTVFIVVSYRKRGFLSSRHRFGCARQSIQFRDVPFVWKINVLFTETIRNLWDLKSGRWTWRLQQSLSGSSFCPSLRQFYA